jgi:hypothetical protein
MHYRFRQGNGFNHLPAILRKQTPTAGQTLERVPNLVIAINPTTEVVGYVTNSVNILPMVCVFTDHTHAQDWSVKTPTIG